ncbi:hypothetical protein LCGC14_0750540 [marine sediment metagenome]|jgi:membrane fusion protein, copper/silver efflux system|uniref:Uncharacterized protein n=1 Tax=marine sediment metagenome TaxID=412755 RepID=A0A0F9TB13_9ZZZZ|nr:efflux RND transporter periplasmic adaptor subunit [Methylophaga sp.]
MNRKQITFLLLAIGVVLVAIFAAYQWGIRQGMDMPPVESDKIPSAKAIINPSNWGISEGEKATRRHIDTGLKAGEIDPVTGRKILYYQDPMVPGNQFEAPGKSPFMDMMLVPVYTTSTGEDTSETEEQGVSISSRIQQNIGIRTALVTKGSIAKQVITVGSIAWNERDQVNVQARALGYVEKLYASATLDRVKKGQPLLTLYVPEWVAIQEDFFALKSMHGNGIQQLIEASIARMRQAGMNETQIRQIKSTGQLQTQITIVAPINGVVTELVAREGMTITPGSTLMRINGLETVWANAEIPESQIELLNIGDPVIASSSAFPSINFKGEIQALLPEVNPITRTLKARIELANPEGRLVPGMFVNMQLAGGQSENTLLVPSEALIRTGKRTLVMLADDKGSFRPVEVTIGIEADDQTQIKQGLKEGDRIVSSGQFLVDSEASLKGIEARLSNKSLSQSNDKTMSKMDMDSHKTQARIESINGQRLTLTHPDIPSLQWPGMTMEFELSSSLKPEGLTVGKQIEVQFHLQENSAPLITDIHLLSSASQADGAQ